MYQGWDRGGNKANNVFTHGRMYQGWDRGGNKANNVFTHGRMYQGWDRGGNKANIFTQYAGSDLGKQHSNSSCQDQIFYNPFALSVSA